MFKNIIRKYFDTEREYINEDGNKQIELSDSRLDLDTKLIKLERELHEK